MLDHPQHGLEIKGDWHDNRHHSNPNSPDICDRTRSTHTLLHPAALHHLRPISGLSPDTKHTTGLNTNSSDINKPRIWSLADMAKKESKEIDSTQPSQSTLYPMSGGGKILSPLAGRYPIHPSPYSKPGFYNAFYNPNPAHLSSGPPDHQSILGSYQLFGTSLAHNRLAAMSSLAMKNEPPGSLLHPLTPLNLPKNSVTPPSGVSPSASSTSSGPEITSPSSHEKQPQSPVSATRP